MKSETERRSGYFFQISRKYLTLQLFLCILYNSYFIIAAQAQLISITLTHPSGPLILLDSANWNEAWIEVDGADPLSKRLTVEDVLVRNDTIRAKILSIDSVCAIFGSNLALSFVLDNSGSMFHSYDSLTQMCDYLVDSLPKGAIAQAITFDTKARTDKHLYTRRSSLFIAQSGFHDSLNAVRVFWHFYDTVRTTYTPLYDAIAAAIANIQSQRSKDSETTREHVVIIVTDGGDNTSRADISTLTDVVSTAHVRLFAITFRSETDHRLAMLARRSNGEYYQAYDITDLRDLLSKIGHRLSTQYHIEYRFPSLGTIPSH